MVLDVCVHKITISCRKVLTSIAGIVLLSIGSVSLSSESSSIASVQKVNAATTKVQLKSNAYVYTKQGVRKRVKSLKRDEFSMRIA